MNLPAAPAINGVLETVLYVDDLSRATEFYRDVMGFRLMTGDATRFQSFDAGDGSVLLLFKRGGTLVPTPTPGGVIPPHDGRGPHHIGFAIATDAYETWKTRLQASGIAIESEGHWQRGGKSLYFRDLDGHLLELITPGIWEIY
jgi:catechol 2,3-dioxygenase-like lactoylglutathione lyase family enzyme